eukprot:TRINITY_DN3286_c0_g1_i1.p1 TRINITY_DN3286_c0_g1~~TRINITY_DN3286_c0_g1_i1.p1  ORF type:complete len:141 (+),score=15.95 TRINITY_DN3286_c0_g1_i1:101-523(+)
MMWILMQCVGCPKVYHPSCLYLKRVPKAAGIVPGMNAISVQKAATAGGIMFRCVRCPIAYCFDDWPEQCPRYKKQDPVVASLERNLNWRNYNPTGVEYCLCAECHGEDERREKERLEKIEEKERLRVEREMQKTEENRRS